MTKSFSMAGWRVASCSGNAEVVAALAKLKSYLDYGTFQPIQIAATVTMNEAPDFPKEVNEIYQSRRDTLLRRPRPHRAGTIEPPAGHDVRVGAHPRALPGHGLGGVRLDAGAGGATWPSRPASASVPGGDGFVRFALIENEQRTHQAVRNLRRALTRLG